MLNKPIPTTLRKLLKDMKRSDNPSDALPLMLLMLNSKTHEDYNTLANLGTVLDSDSLLTFLQVFEGTTIKVPSLHDYRITMLALMVVYEKELMDESYSGVLSSLSTAEYNEVYDLYLDLRDDEVFKYLLKGMSS